MATTRAYTLGKRKLSNDRLITQVNSITVVATLIGAFIAAPLTDAKPTADNSSSQRYALALLITAASALSSTVAGVAVILTLSNTRTSVRLKHIELQYILTGIYFISLASLIVSLVSFSWALLELAQRLQSRISSPRIVAVVYTLPIGLGAITAFLVILYLFINKRKHGGWEPWPRFAVGHKS